MLGLKPSGRKSRVEDPENGDIARLFFDSFSKRVETVEDSVRKMSTGFDKMKLSIERGQISDLVLLDRLQKMENLIRDSLVSIKSAIEPVSLHSGGSQDVATAVQIPPGEPMSVGKVVRNESAISSQVFSPTGEIGSLRSITTPTELQVLTLLMSEGPKSAPEIGRAVGRSREHTARLMKKLHGEGYVRRDQTRIPFRYSAVDRLKQVVKKPETRDEGKEPISVPQT
jgi:hypothetical protein